MRHVSHNTKNGKQSKTALTSFGNTIVGAMPMTSDLQANERKQKSTLAAKAMVPNGRRGQVDHSHYAQNQGSREDIVTYQDLLKPESHGNQENFRQADFENNQNQEFQVNINDYGN